MPDAAIPTNLERALNKLESTAGSIPTVINPGNLQHAIRQLRAAIEKKLAMGLLNVKQVEREVLEIETRTQVLIVQDISTLTTRILQGLI
jgi:hypothetical protein